MFSTLLRKLRGWRDLRVHEGKLRDARKARLLARQRFREAQARNDDRDLGRALMQLRQATADTLRLELGR